MNFDPGWPWTLLVKVFDIKYFENGNSYDDGVNVSQIGSHTRVIDWHRDLGWSWTILGHRIFTSNVSKMVKDMMLDTKDVREETNHELSIGTVNFDPRWPWTFTVQGH